MSMTTRQGQPVPMLGLGTWRMGESARQHAREVEAVACALELGYRVIDTAEMYGEGGAERVVGEALRRSAVPRDDVFVVSKAYPQHGSVQGLHEACRRSLERLGLAQLDLYLLHWRGGVPLAATVEGMLALQQQGLIRAWGVSNFDVEDMQELVAAGGGACAANQIYFSPTEQGAGVALLPWLRERAMLTMAYSPVDQGALADHAELAALAAPLGLSAAQLALAWVLQHEGVMAIPKAVQAVHLRENLAAASLRLDSATRAALQRLFPAPRRRSALAMR